MQTLGLKVNATTAAPDSGRQIIDRRVLDLTGTVVKRTRFDEQSVTLALSHAWRAFRARFDGVVSSQIPSFRYSDDGFDAVLGGPIEYRFDCGIQVVTTWVHVQGNRGALIELATFSLKFAHGGTTHNLELVPTDSRPWRHFFPKPVTIGAHKARLVVGAS